MPVPERGLCEIFLETNGEPAGVGSNHFHGPLLTHTRPAWEGRRYGMPRAPGRR